MMMSEQFMSVTFVSLFILLILPCPHKLLEYCNHDKVFLGYWDHNGCAGTWAYILTSLECLKRKC